jgi:hypothetical protein
MVLHDSYSTRGTSVTSGVVWIVMYTNDNIGVGHGNGHMDKIFNLIDFGLQYMSYNKILSCKVVS